VVSKLAMITGRPVKCTLTREEVFYAHRGRHPVLMWVRTGVTRDGLITAMHFKSALDGGAYGSYGVASTFYTGVLQPITYDIPAYRFEGCRVFTNKPPCGPKRGHGTPQPRFALELHLEKIAHDLGLDPAEMKRKNFVKPMTRTVNWLRVTSCGLEECAQKVLQASGYRDRKRVPGRGMGFAISSYLSGAGTAIYWNDMPHSEVQIKVDRGGVTAYCGAMDIGQGSDSVLAAIVAEQLGLLHMGWTETTRMANGTLDEADVTESLYIEIMQRRTTTHALVMGDTVLIGAIVLEGLDLAVDCLRGKLLPNLGTWDQPVFRV